MPLWSHSPLSVNRTCDLLLANRIWQRWWMSLLSLCYTGLQFPSSRRLFISSVSWWLWWNKLPYEQAYMASNRGRSPANSQQGTRPCQQQHELGSESFLRQASDKTSTLAGALITALWNPKAEAQLSHALISDHGNSERIIMCYFKLLSLWSFIMQQSITKLVFS